MLDFVLSIGERFPNLDDVVVARGQSLGGKFSHAVVNCLTSSKVETRSKAEELLKVCVENEVLALDSIKACTERMKPAQQRSIGPFIAKLARSVPGGSNGGKENVPADDVAHDRELQKNSNRANTAQSTRRTQDSQKPRSLATSTQATKESQRSGPSSGLDLKSEEVKHGKDRHLWHKEQADLQMHPLIGALGSAAVEKSHAALRSMTWPEYPEEPLGSEIYLHLKKAWSPTLPSSSCSCLFPTGGIKNQDDGKPGCDLLAKAILMERAGEGVVIDDQLEFIFRWIVIVLCSKEHTVGLQALLSLLYDLFLYLKEIKYELSDSEALLLLPFVLEKASLAKGRFKDVFDDLLVVVKDEDVLPLKRLGSVVAVAIVERATHAKARAVASQDCAKCVDQLGLSGIGKKGVLVTAKAVSEETLPENRNATLDLMEMILSRMNGDIPRLARICGSSLSEKARHLIEERWEKRKANPTSITASRQTDDSSARRRSRIPTPQKSSPADKGPIFSGISSLSTTPGSKVAESPAVKSAVLYDGLPALNLRHSVAAGAQEEPNYAGSPEKIKNSKSSTTSDTFSSKSLTPGFDHSVRSKKFESLQRERSTDPNVNYPAVNISDSKEGFGAAASLRARLMKIREKSRNPDMSLLAASASDRAPNTALQPLNDPGQMAPKTATLGSTPNTDTARKIDEGSFKTGDFSVVMAPINILVQKSTPLSEGDEDLEAAIETSKKLHAALSKQQNIVTGLTEGELATLRESIVLNVDELIENLSR